MNVKELLEEAQEVDSSVKSTTFKKELGRLVDCGQIICVGKGRRGDPYRYYRPLDEQIDSGI